MRLEELESRTAGEDEEQAERHLNLKWESQGVAQSGPKCPEHGPGNTDRQRAKSLQYGSIATLFACGAGDGNRTRTVSLGTNLIRAIHRG